jgi:hypothetical protein
VQKFTRPITREIEIGGERLALTFGEQGIAVRPVGSRKPPKEITWAGVLTHMASPGPGSPSPEQLSAALEQLRGPGGKSAPKPESGSAPAEQPEPAPSSVSPTAPPP